MEQIPLNFFPPKTETNPILTADPVLAGSSALNPLSKAAKKKKRKKKCKAGDKECERMIGPYGPVNAFGMSSTIGGADGSSPAPTYGYGNSNYGARPYGEAINKRSKYVLYGNEFKEFSSLEELPVMYEK